MFKKIVIIGGGVMGLATAYHLLKGGNEVELFEADDRVGGMASHFDFDGLDIERYYHFICKADYHYIDLLNQLGISEKLNWVNTQMGFFYNGKLYEWGTPWALMFFPKLDFISKLRYGMHVFYSTKINNWQELDQKNAFLWIKKWVGEKAYKVLWKKLFELKFYGFKENLSAAWMWSRLKRLGTSRNKFFKEEIGYLDGGSKTLLETLEKQIKSLGGKIHLSSPVKAVYGKSGKKKVVTDDKKINTDVVISTIPLPYISSIFKDLDEKIKNQYEKIENISVVCVVVKCSGPLSQYFWLNINDDRIEIPGVIEYSNLKPLEDHIIYVPYYLPQDHQKLNEKDEYFIQEVKKWIDLIKKKSPNGFIISQKVFRYQYAQPICPPEFLKKLPSVKVFENDDIYIADTSYYYPEDRSISESLRFANKIADMVVVKK